MAAFNQVTIIGNLTRDVQVKYLPTGKAVADGGIAVNEQWKDGSRTDFFNFKAWGRTAEVLGEYCKKGDSVLLAGKLRYESWEKDGAKHSAVHIEVVQMQMMPKSRGGSGGGTEGAGQHDEPPARDMEQRPDELPF